VSGYSNACPAGSVRIETEAACRTAAGAAGKAVSKWMFLRTSATYPRGCYYDHLNDVYFNTDPVGGSSWSYTLLCAAVTTTGAPDRCARTRINIYIET
jgi:hypothetical protein